MTGGLPGITKALAEGELGEVNYNGEEIPE